jgi:hypothetical protein
VEMAWAWLDVKGAGRRMEPGRRSSGRQTGKSAARQRGTSALQGKACRKGLRMNFFWGLALACEGLPSLAKDSGKLAGNQGIAESLIVLPQHWMNSDDFS